MGIEKRYSLRDKTMTAPATCAQATSLFTVTCMDNLVINLQPVIATDTAKTNCFTNAYAGLSLSDLKISPPSNNANEVVCKAASQTKTAMTTAGTSTANFFWG